MNEYIIHKVGISLEAKFDYEDCLELGIIPKTDIKKLVEQYLTIRKLQKERYLRLKYLDENSDKMLLLFIKLCGEFSFMQIWSVKGICFERDFDDELEFLGINRNWYESPIDITGNIKYDWVKDLNNDTSGKIPQVKIYRIERNIIYEIRKRGIL